MTLIDTRPGFAECLHALSAEAGVQFDVEALVSSLGPPLDLMLRPYLPGWTAEQVDALVQRFRALYPATAVKPTLAFPGAHEALAAVRRQRGRSLVITGKYTPNARLRSEEHTSELQSRQY